MFFFKTFFKFMCKNFKFNYSSQLVKETQQLKDKLYKLEEDSDAVRKKLSESLLNKAKLQSSLDGVKCALNSTQQRNTELLGETELLRKRLSAEEGKVRHLEDEKFKLMNALSINEGDVISGIDLLFVTDDSRRFWFGLFKITKLFLTTKKAKT